MNPKTLIISTLAILYAGYSLLVYTTGTKASGIVMNKNAISGKMLFQKYNCTSCHQFYGLGGYLGPELTTVISQPGKGELYARAILKSGTERMPDFHLNDEEINNLVQFLKDVDSTAVTYKDKK